MSRRVSTPVYGRVNGIHTTRDGRPFASIVSRKASGTLPLESADDVRIGQELKLHLAAPGTFELAA